MRGKRAEIRLWVLWGGIGIAAMAVAGVIGPVFLSGLWTIVPLIAVSLANSVAMPVLLNRRSRHLRAAHRAADGRICANCGHSLVGLDDTGTCPECGAPYRLADLRRRWRDVIGEEHRAARTGDNRD